MSDHNAQLAYPWNAPLQVIDPETFGRAQPTALRQVIQSYINEDIRIDARLDEETVAFLTNTDEGKRINLHLHRDEERRIRLEKVVR
ncbi:TPA: replication endonuclease, partial [Escherichia coli]|nr:replication endonuclease [Escherichia coli]